MDTITSSTGSWMKHSRTHLRDGQQRPECPFCDKGAPPASSDIVYYRHVADHLREVSLAALPQASYSSDNGDSETSDGSSEEPSEPFNLLSRESHAGLIDTSGVWRLPEDTCRAIPGYVSMYWKHFDPGLPILHRTWTVSTTNDALRCIMAAVGAQYCPGKADRIRSAQLHEFAWQQAIKVGQTRVSHYAYRLQY